MQSNQLTVFVINTLKELFIEIYIVQVKYVHYIYVGIKNEPNEEWAMNETYHTR